MKSLELTRSGILGTVMVLIIVVVCVRLGLWQLERREHRLALNAAIAGRLAAEPVPLDGSPLDTTGLTYRRATIEGELDAGRSIVLAGRSHGGAPGAYLLVPLRTGEAAILVNRGWLPAPDAASVDAGSASISGPVVVQGVLMPFPDVDVERPAGFTRTWYRFAGAAIRGQYPYPVAPLYLRATAAPVGPAAPDTVTALPVLLEPPAQDPGPHLSYAIQWFSFAGIFLIGWLTLLVRRKEPEAPEDLR
jgi:surfeit locus 1 family protein